MSYSFSVSALRDDAKRQLLAYATDERIPLGLIGALLLIAESWPATTISVSVEGHDSPDAAGYLVVRVT